MISKALLDIVISLVQIFTYASIAILIIGALISIEPSLREKKIENNYEKFQKRER